MGEHNTGQTSILVAQVRKATADHRVDPESGLLRAKSFPKPNKVVYLGDVAKAVLNCLDLSKSRNSTNKNGHSSPEVVTSKSPSHLNRIGYLDSSILDT